MRFFAILLLSAMTGMAAMPIPVGMFKGVTLQCGGWFYCLRHDVSWDEWD